ncbi:hypothetical protein [Candidatus Weimeria sp. HCP3S3_B5]|uniref:hypothetical protein n=1 Tax=Candidatus Weimeria sp. HCP3S3_B5 TaxID=3438871 RepID=UPI003F89D0BA
MDLEEVKRRVSDTKIPVLVLDQKWHRLFALEGKPDEIKTSEVALNELLKEQGGLGNELKELKKVKKKLMANIVDHVNEAGSTNVTKDASMIDETNRRIEEIEDRLLELPKEIKNANNQLMERTVEFAYQRMRTNTDEINEISEWIKDIRVKLKKNIIRKQNREINNREIYSYMHDIFGKDMVTLFDITDDDQIVLTSKDSYMSGHSAEDNENDKEDTPGEWRSKGALGNPLSSVRKGGAAGEKMDPEKTGDNKASSGKEG